MVDNPIKELSADEAWNRLGQAELGRIALSYDGQPDIYPVNYLCSDRRIIFRTAQGTKLYELTANSHVAFETDDHDADGGWSVVVKGTARVLESHREIEAADTLPLRTWLPTLKYNYVEISADEITGREFTFGPEPERYTGED
ncbi:pyridoxamine 5'-phosphate oxidase-related FMN- binding protein [Gordonia bronchialis DSM 43247]|uniref:Pyridoxamine 5'-phosphate oxidase-related FMN-binding protein n=1 Tax=Gordonia bronchialis (strain ATCC 25592 / DSM 43247 / BCRC 13721 / JCM 3198 / KCTC 3076 / NBRC 16047 / NCTC 10667) TaxID=526226 RepID=D0L8P1_GORB4|nr:pyridoxamine 5'-phosphate oxidase family protein [Gordonia bronchialis]ACY21058.1 pyridoxamine 5'-phosphate oxidase-related FMN- binding protein [Gordonia bronchialis DSM 43247]MCC3323843.1 pyridoxamine 5'-phosphate oxidase family protein [Gordonia bronchialis]QGS25229.1 pyridoxamine 5'-phosphate oxidase family protein [Gordonia bronchialis]UAK38475.1 pyridoxamine 5'-phosphate oxidase family protein [Gordonia bronchialis]STQ63922.1 PPOX class probable F420-dependent enzyme [Gordonia bronchi